MRASQQWGRKDQVGWLHCMVPLVLPQTLCAPLRPPHAHLGATAKAPQGHIAWLSCGCLSSLAVLLPPLCSDSCREGPQNTSTETTACPTAASHLCASCTSQPHAECLCPFSFLDACRVSSIGSCCGEAGAARGLGPCWSEPCLTAGFFDQC